MKTLIEHYAEEYNAKVTEMEKLPHGDDRAIMKQVLERIHSELIMASNLIESGKSADYILIRIDKLLK